MSDTTSNTHFSTDATNIAAALDAQTEATLALAYEQHTANLIAFYATIPSKLGSDTQQLRSQILERLCLS